MARNPIAGRTALVTGANRGIGLAVTKALLEAGAKKVYAGARRPETLTALVKEYGERVVPMEIDWSHINTKCCLRRPRSFLVVEHIMEESGFTGHGTTY